MRSRAEVNEAQGQVEGESLDDRDLAAWVELQVELLRSGQATGLDVDNLIEELEGLTKRDERTLGSQLKRVMAHLLKQRYQAERATRSSEDSIANGREEIAVILEQSPSLRRTLPGLMTKNYPRAVFQAARDTRLPVTTFPTQPPFTLAEVLGEEEQPRLWQTANKPAGSPHTCNTALRRMLRSSFGLLPGSGPSRANLCVICG